MRPEPGVTLQDAPAGEEGTPRGPMMARVAEALPPPRPGKSPVPAWTLPAVDFVLALLAFVLGYIARYELTIFRAVMEINQAPFAPYLPYALLYAATLYFAHNSNGLYRQVRGRSLVEELSISANGIATATVMQLALVVVFQALFTSRLMLLYVAVLTLALMALGRVAHRLLLASLRARGIGTQRVLIVGAGESGAAVLRVMMARKDFGYEPVGFVDDQPGLGQVSFGRIKGLGSTARLEEVIRRQGIDLVIITLPWSQHDQILAITHRARQAGADVRAVPDVFQLNTRQMQVENLDGIPLLGFGRLEQRRFQGTERVIKRAIDIGLVLLSAPLWLPLVTLAALAVWLESRGPVLYPQRRVGEGGREFNMIKFRSMVPDAERLREQLVQDRGADPRHPKIRDDPRITRVGAFIRSASIDELPQFLNVLRGEMSLVGPRPPTPDEVALYEPWHRQRLQTIPGCTGLWQVSGRSNVPFDEMCLLDIYYIENWSVRLDLQIIVMTLPHLLLRRGAW